MQRQIFTAFKVVLYGDYIATEERYNTDDLPLTDTSRSEHLVVVPAKQTHYILSSPQLAIYDVLFQDFCNVSRRLYWRTFHGHKFSELQFEKLQPALDCYRCRCLGIIRTSRSVLVSSQWFYEVRFLVSSCGLWHTTQNSTLT